MKRTPILTAALVATLFFVSCKNSGKSDLPIPKDAAMVMVVNTASLTSKLSWEDIKASNYFKEMAAEAKDSFAKKLLENPENSGIDLKGNIAMFAKKQGRGGYMVVEGKLKDAAAFEAMLKEMNKEAKVEKNGDLNYINTEDNNIVSWNSSYFISMTDAPMFNMMTPGMTGGMGEAYNFPVDSLKKFTADLLKLDSKSSLDQDDRFAAVMKDGGDMFVWMNTDSYMSGIGGALSMLKIGDLLKDNAVAYALSFDEGKISVKAKGFYGKEMSKLMEKYETKNISKDLINRIPSQDVVGVMAFNFDPKIIKEFLVAAGVDGMANGFLGEQGLTLDEVLGASKGEFLISVSDVTMTKKEKVVPAFYEGGEPYTYTTTEPDMNFIFATSVGNKATFDKLMNMAKSEMKGALEDTSKFNYQLNNEWFVASNRADNVNKFIAGGNNKIAFTDRITGHPFGMYIDLQKIMKTAGSHTSNEYDSATLQESLKVWKDVVGTGGEYKNGIASFEMEINMVDKGKNSLKQINEYAEKLYNLKKQYKKDVVMDDTITDTTITITAPADMPY